MMHSFCHATAYLYIYLTDTFVQSEECLSSEISVSGADGRKDLPQGPKNDAITLPDTGFEPATF